MFVHPTRAAATPFGCFAGRPRLGGVLRLTLIAIFVAIAPTRSKASPGDAPGPPPAVDVGPRLAKSIHESVSRASTYLCRRQSRTGVFDPSGYGSIDDKGYEYGVSALCLLAIREAGDPGAKAALDLGLAALFGPASTARRRVERSVYASALSLLLLAGDARYGSVMPELLDALVRAIDRNSSYWSYGGPGSASADPNEVPEFLGTPNLSCSYFAVLGLLAASAAGLEVPTKLRRAHLTALVRAQSSLGSWGYEPAPIASGGGAEASTRGDACNTSIGLSSFLMLSRRTGDPIIDLDGSGGASPKVAGALERARAAFDRDASRILVNPGGSVDIDVDSRVGPAGIAETGSRMTGMGAYYTLFGVSTCAMLLGVEEISAPREVLLRSRGVVSPKVAWYAAGAKWLLKIQNVDGGWPSRFDASERQVSSDIDTAFALLFLVRGPQVIRSAPAPAVAAPTTPSEPKRPGEPASPMR